MSATPHTSLFTQVDRSDDPDFFVRFMDEAQKSAAIQASKRLMLERAALIAGDAVLDVGCGLGTDLYDIAGRRSVLKDVSSESTRARS
jgi:cyclopropane fatty-acyl-phospholipid synthase-like methyltransferase